MNAYRSGGLLQVVVGSPLTNCLAGLNAGFDQLPKADLAACLGFQHYDYPRQGFSAVFE